MPDTPRLSRRAFLAGGLGLAVAAACGEDGGGAGAPGTTGTPEPDDLEVVVATAQFVAGTDQRVTVAVLRDAAPLGGDPVRVAFGRSPRSVGQSRPAEFHGAGIEERPYYLTRFRFPEAGEWWVQAESGGKRGAARFDVIHPQDTEIPLPGGRMVPVVTPTPADPRGVDPICTRKPPCPWHDVTLDAALGEGRPLAVLFATPALCTSRVCGPVLDVLLAEAPRFADRVRFLHVEVWRNLQAQFREEDLTEGMRAYHLTFEPILYLAGSDGVIRERLDGPFDRREAATALARLAG